MPACIAWGEEREQVCSETRDQGFEECTQTRDEGNNQCATRRAECCTWWPCSWACEVVSWVCVAWVWVSNVVCVAWTWVSNIVCVAWTWISTAVCVAWDAVTTVVNAILVTLESILGWVLSAIAFVVELIEAIPVLGTLIRWVLNFVTFLINTIASIPDFVLGLIGIRPEKKLRVCPVILDDGSDPEIRTEAVQLLQLACNVYKRDANIRIVPLGPFQYDTGFDGAETVDETWLNVVEGVEDPEVLDVPCEGGGAGAEWWTPGSKLQLLSSTRCFYGAWRRVLGYGAPITVFFIRSVPGALGCGLWITDYVTVASNALPGTRTTPASPRTAAHELGHACNLWHICVDDDVNNLMATEGACSPASETEPERANPEIADWQALLIRASKHVTYF